MAPPKKKSKNAVDPTWNHCVRATELTDPEAVDNTRLKLVCNYCGKTLSGGVSRMKHHLARTHHNAKPCEKVPEDVTNMFLKILGELKQRNCIEQDDVDCFDEVEKVISKRGSMDKYVSKTKAKQVTLPSMLKKRTKPCVDICRMIYAETLPFSLVKSSWFHTAVQSIGKYGKGLKPPSYHEVRVTFLKKEVDNVQSTLDKYKSEWKKTGCSLMSDGWQDGCGRSITNFLVNSPKGTVFLKSLDTSSIIKNGVALFESLIILLRKLVKKMYCLKGVLPLIKVLRLVDGDAKPAMGYIYEAMDRAKEQIEKNFNKVKRRYAAIWKIVDERWALQLHRPLHVAAYFLNPRFHYDASFEADEEVRLGLYTVIERMQKKREENGDAYDPICLSDMESDDEWITEREDPCLPLDPSWMDMNECFEVNEGETSRKGRRGPRNLQNDSKGKRKFVGEENEVEVIDDDVEKEIEEEEEEYIGDDGVP
ncbi:hypothetical protein RHGRI_036889 [Rhododendron griersonianum]|uniref:BED-type domain-containing protein n=1 Tax=Rhododendron griersonianum TaxID=479676 RepID=A0AAV6HTJ6_9ERIC|nr:hypothetical protein RHGRI_036889 [Rhododendron griersonianum]